MLIIGFYLPLTHLIGDRLRICEDGSSIIARYLDFPGNLNQILDDCLKLIRTHLYYDATFLKPSTEIIVEHPSIPATARIIQLSAGELLKIFTDYSADEIGRLDGLYEHGKVFLNKGMWCVASIIHEALHACSLISLVGKENEPVRPLYEGLTELYTGYILFKEFRNLYDFCWRGDTDVICQLRYYTTTGVWGTFCHFVPMSETFRVYFYTGSRDLRATFDQFVERLHVLGHEQFKNPLTIPLDKPTHLKFYDQCRKNFGEKACDRYYNHPELSLDFENIRVG